MRKLTSIKRIENNKVQAVTEIDGHEVLLTEHEVTGRDLSEAKIYEKYPKIFRQKDLDKSQTCMCWGLDIGLGWHWLVDKLCEFLQFDIDNNGRSQIEAVQVKQKFGGLRFYVDKATSEQYEAICFAEFLSYFICEECGSTKGVTQNKTGWIVTLCEECRGKEEK